MRYFFGFLVFMLVCGLLIDSPKMAAKYITCREAHRALDVCIAAMVTE